MKSGFSFSTTAFQARPANTSARPSSPSRVHTSKAGFHWLLAQLSGRTIQQLSPGFAELCTVPKRFHLRDNDALDGWHQDHPSVAGVRRDRRQGSARRAVQGLWTSLTWRRADKILQHLEVFLNGPLVDQMWARIRGKALHQRMVPAREKRVWKFFQPEPTGPWERPLRASRRHPRRPSQGRRRNRLLDDRGGLPRLLALAGWRPSAGRRLCVEHCWRIRQRDERRRVALPGRAA